MNTELPEPDWTEKLAYFLGRREIFLIEGDSMLPTLRDGDYVFIDTAAELKVGDIALALHPFKKSVKIIKRIAEISSEGNYFLVGDNLAPGESSDSRNFGAIRAKDILGKAVCRLTFAKETQMKIEKIHHVAIICSDYERSKRFYTEVLGLEIIEETFRAERNSYKLDLRVGELDQIELFSFPNPPERPNRPEAQGLRHLAFSVKNLDEAVRVLEAKGVAVEPVRVDEITGKRFTFFQDPDRLPLEIYEI